MKSKKKFLLLGVGVMGALALGVGATSTFAWFQATATQNQTLSSNVSLAAQASYGDGLNLVLEWGDGSTAINLTGVYETDSQGTPYVFANDGSLVPVPGSPKIVESAQLNIKFTIGSSNPVAATVNTLKPFAGTYRVLISGSTQTTKVGGTAQTDNPSRMKLANVSDQAPTSTLKAMDFTVTIGSDGHITSIAPTTSNAALGNWGVHNEEGAGDGRYITATTTVYMALDGGTAADTISAGEHQVQVDSAVTGSFSISNPAQN